MTRLSLRWIFLVPILATMVIGFTVFAIYADRVERNNRLADIDAELIRAEARNGNTAPNRRDQPTPPPEEGAELTDIDNPVQLLINPDGLIISTGVSGNPFPASTINELITMEGFHTIGDQNFRVRVNTPNGQPTSVTALSLDLVDEATNEFRQALALGGGIIQIGRAHV